MQTLAHCPQQPAPAVHSVTDDAIRVLIVATGRHGTRYIASTTGRAPNGVKQFAPSSLPADLLIMNISRRICNVASGAFLALTVSLLAAPAGAHRHDGPSAVSAISALPVASVASAAVAGVAASASAATIPVALSAGGARLVVRSVESTARGTLCVLERVTDGARVAIEVAGRDIERGSLAIGRSVEVSVSTAGVVLSAAGEVVAFIPSELGRALIHNERITY